MTDSEEISESLMVASRRVVVDLVAAEVEALDVIKVKAKVILRLLKLVISRFRGRDVGVVPLRDEVVLVVVSEAFAKENNVSVQVSSAIVRAAKVSALATKVPRSSSKSFLSLRAERLLIQ